MEIFLEAINSYQHEIQLRLVDPPNPGPLTGEQFIEIATGHNRFGHFVIEGDISALPAEHLALIHNAISMLAVVLENRQREALLADENLHLESAVQQRTKQLQHYQQTLEERVAERTARLEAINHELEAFSYSVSHDLRAPLRSIHGFSQILMEDQLEKLDGEAQAHLQRIMKAATHMSELIEDLLKLSRFTCCKLDITILDLSTLAHEIIAELNETTSSHKVIIAEQLHTTADRNLMHIVLSNLLGNAWKYSAKNQNPQIEFGQQNHHGETVFFVRDNGAGFDMNSADKLFTPFQRLHNKKEFSGTGIGLATVQRIIHRHGGKIWAEGKVDEGATFYFTLGKSTKD